MDIIEIPKLLPNSFADELENHLMGYQFPWHYNAGVSYDKLLTEKFIEHDPMIKDVDGFVNPLFINGHKTSAYADLLKPMIYFLEEKTNVAVREVLRIRTIWINKNSNFGDFYNVPHVDDPQPHNTMIYYVNDCDGDTILFKEFFSGQLDYTKKTVERKIQPCKNKCVVFNGLRYHTGSVPKYNHRVIININFR
jgi:hypothetical protein